MSPPRQPVPNHFMPRWYRGFELQEIEFLYGEWWLTVELPDDFFLVEAPTMVTGRVGGDAIRR